MDWGDWEGKKGLDLKAAPDSGFKDIEEWGWDFCPPNGESPRQVWNRLRPWVHGLTNDSVAVCHIGIMRVLLARAFGWEFEGVPPFKIKRNRLFLLEINGSVISAVEPQIRLEARN
jgi:probable phosphoglycerate mutase